MRWLTVLTLILGGSNGLLPAATAAPDAPKPRLAYPVEAMNAGEAYALARPGAGGSAFALRLTVSGPDWARWNLPRFPAGEGRQSVRLSARALAEGVTPRLRVLEEDGSEWDSTPLTLGREWQSFTLGASAFKYFRSRDSRRGTPVNFGRVIQIQLVLSGTPAGTGFEIDDVRLEPGGRRFTFEEAEQRAPVSPSDARRARVGAVLSGLAAERRLVALQREWARKCAADLEALLRDRRPGETYAAFTARHGQGTFAFQTSPPASAPPYEVKPVTPEQLAAYSRKITPEPLALAIGDAAAWRSSRLYSAPEPPPAAALAEGGKTGVRLATRFTDTTDQQVAFLNSPAFEPFGTRRRDLIVELRLGPTPLDPEMPLLLRLWSHAPGEGRESWADFRPEGLDTLPRGEWATLRFPLGKAYRGTAFEPDHVVALSFRLQNAPGKEAAVDLGVARMSLLPRDPETLGVEEMVREALAEVDRDRLTLWRDLETLRAARERVWADPVAQRFVLRAQLRACPPGSVATVSDPLPAAKETAPADAERGFEAIPTVAADGSGEVRLRWRVPAEAGDVAQGVAALLDHSGRAAATAPLEVKSGVAEATLRVPGVRRWSPAFPYLYRVKAALVRDGKPVAAVVREAGFRTIEARAGDVTPLLRHAWAPAPWEGGVWLNGQPYFPNGALYHLPQGATRADVAPVLRDLWVDALRTYGWSYSPEGWADGDREGIGSYASMAPAYKTLRDVSDVDMLFDEYGERLRGVSDGLHHPSILNWHVGNEVELSVWGADLPSIFPEAIWIPLERALQQVRAAAGSAPRSYVRAGTIRDLPVLPGEELVGVNQYTGRYGGRIEQVAAHLDLFARWCQAAGRPLGITEWNGPQYSWAANGIGGVSERGAAYYVQRYYEAMVDTPGIGLSSEFTLNWILWRVEDLTTRSREEEWRDRPAYSQFGGGSTADHVPQVPLGKEYRESAPYKAVQAFHSPWHPILRAPGRIAIGYALDMHDEAERLAEALAPFGKEMVLMPLIDAFDAEQMDAHVVLIGGVGAAQPAPVKKLERAGWIDPCLDGFPAGDRPLVQRRVHPYFPTRGLVAVSGATVAARAEGVRHLTASAEALRDLWAQEGAMVRVVALTDAPLASTYERLLFEFVGRGYLLGGDDTRETLDAAEFLDAEGKLRPAWWNLNALVLDAARALAPAELEGVRRLARTGVRIVISLPCYRVNPELQQLLGVRVGAAHSLTDPVEPAPEACRPVPVNQVGRVQEAVIKRFQPGAKLDALEVRELEAPGATPLAWTAQRKPVAVRIQREKEQYALLGFGIGSVAALHRRVATSGQTHRLYDRDTASGLERAGRFAINVCLEGMPQPRLLPRLRGVARVEDAFLKPGARSALVVRLYDTEGRPQTGAAVRACAQMATEARPSGPMSALVDLAEVSPGVYRCPLALGGADAKGALAIDPGRTATDAVRAVSVQIRAIRPGTVPWEGGASAWVEGW